MAPEPNAFGPGAGGAFGLDDKLSTAASEAKTAAGAMYH